MAQNSENLPVSFEEALIELEKIVRQLEEGKTPLDDSIKAYERGTELKNFCEGKLRDAQLRIDKISVAQNGALSSSPFDEKQ